MDLTPHNQTLLYRLLCERERQLVTVADSEQKIEAILGTLYPFVLPSDLPSQAKRKKGRKSRKKVTKRTIRRLKTSTEDAYLVRFVHDDEEKTEIIREYRLIQTLVKEDIPSIKILSIVSVKFSTETEHEIVDGLYFPRY